MRRVQSIYVTAGLALTFAVYCQQAFAECGTASTYWEGSRTANGEHYNPSGISAAHKSLPFGTRVLVTHQRTGRSVLVRINDRGPFVGGRIIDLSTGAKHALGMDGLAPVCLQVVSNGGGSVRMARHSGSKHVRIAHSGHNRRYAHVHRRHTRLASVRHHRGRYASVRHTNRKMREES